MHRVKKRDSVELDILRAIPTIVVVGIALRMSEGALRMSEGALRMSEGALRMSQGALRMSAGALRMFFYVY